MTNGDQGDPIQQRAYDLLRMLSCDFTSDVSLEDVWMLADVVQAMERVVAKIPDQILPVNRMEAMSSIIAANLFWDLEPDVEDEGDNG